MASSSRRLNLDEVGAPEPKKTKTFDSPVSTFSGLGFLMIGIFICMVKFFNLECDIFKMFVKV